MSDFSSRASPCIMPDCVYNHTMRITILISAITLLMGMATACNVPADPDKRTESSEIEQVFEQRKSDVQVEGEGTVTRILSDDQEGSRHQRFIVRIASGQTVLIQHNIDLAPRVPDLKVGDTVSFFGEYIWNEQGGLIHWTHHDPAGSHVGGWIKHNGETYQ